MIGMLMTTRKKKRTKNLMRPKYNYYPNMWNVLKNIIWGVLTLTNLKGFIIYKIYYASGLIYLGRTKQPLKSRLRGHFFELP